MSWGHEHQEGKVMTYRCTICNINWAHSGRYSTCQGCNEVCAAVSADPEDVLTEAQSLAHAYNLAQERARAAELARQEGILAEAKARRIEDAAAAALHYDLEFEWAKATPEYLASWAEGSA